MGYLDEYESSLSKEFREPLISGTHLRFKYWNNYDFEGVSSASIVYDATNENRPSREYNIQKTVSMINYLEEVKKPENDRKIEELTGTMQSLLLIYKAVNKFLSIFGLSKVTWNGFDINAIAKPLDDATNTLAEYLRKKKEYYELLPMREEFGSPPQPIDYKVDELPDNVKSRHRDIGFMRANILNQNRNYLFEFQKKLIIARGFWAVAVSLADQISPTFRKLHNTLNEYLNDLNNAKEALNDLRTALIIVAPAISRAAAPNGDGVMATLCASLISHLGTALTYMEKISMYLNYFMLVNADLEEYVRKSRSSDVFIQEYNAQL